MHVTRSGYVLHFEYLYAGAGGLLGDDGLDENDGLDEDKGYRYILVMMDVMSNWVWLEPMGKRHVDSAASLDLVQDYWGSGDVKEWRCSPFEELNDRRVREAFWC